MIIKLLLSIIAIREDRTRGGRSTYQCSYTLPAGVASGGPLSNGAINLGTSNPASSSPSSSCSPSTAFSSPAHATFHNGGNLNTNGPSSLPSGLPSAIGNTKQEDDMDISSNVSTMVRSSWSANPTPTPSKVDLANSPKLPPNITEGPPPLEQTAPVSLTTKSNVPALLKVSIIFISYDLI